MKTIEEMLPSVQAATEDGRLKWANKEMTFSVKVGKYTISTWQWSDPDNDVEGYSVGIYEGDKQLDYIRADPYSPRYSRLEDFYRMARRSALNLGDIIEEIERALNSIAKR
jgi:hypothetical protein